MHNAFTVVASGLVLTAFYCSSPVSLFFSRLLYGIQGGMSCVLVPTYLNEVSAAEMRGRTGITHQFGITLGILLAQIAGFRQLLGTESLWYYSF